MPSSPNTVLVVDDEPAIRKMLGVMLSQAGIAHESAGSAQEALALLSGAQVNAVISDLRMPGMSGLELLAEVQRKYPDLAFLVATGVDDVRVGVQAMKEGADDYLVRPFKPRELLARIRAEHSRYRVEERQGRPKGVRRADQG